MKAIFCSCMLFVLVHFQLSGQSEKPKVFIEYNNESEGWINEFLGESSNWIIVGTFDESNVVFRVQMSQNTARAFGKIFIIDSQTGETLYSTENLKGQSSAFNGYAPKKNLSKKLISEIETKFDKSKINLSHFGKNKNQRDAISGGSDKYDKLTKLKKLLDDGAITKDEYEKEKKKILDEKDN